MTTVRKITGNKKLQDKISKKSHQEVRVASPRVSKWPKFYLRAIAIVGRKQAKKLISFHMNNSHSVAIGIIRLKMKLIWRSEIMWRRYRHPNNNHHPRRRNQSHLRHFGRVQLQQNIPIRNQCTNFNLTSQQMKIYHQIKFKGNHFPKRRY